MAPSRSVRTKAQFVNQLLDRRAPDLLQAITDLIGIYSTSPTSHLGLAARIDGFTPDALDRLVTDKVIVRMGAMRGSGYFIPVELVPTIVAAIGTRREAIFSEIVGKMMSARTYERLAKKIEKIVAGDELTTAQIRKAVKEPRYDEHIRYVIRLMTTECRLVPTRTSGTWRSNLIYLARWSEWFPEVDPWSVEPDQARRELARRFFRAHGPATVEDFAWWSGLKKGAAEVVAAAGIDEVERGYFGAIPDAKSAKGVRLLPIWDGLFLTHKDRTHAVSDELYHHVYDPSGNPTSVVVVNGVAAGHWDLKVTKSHHLIKVAPFERFSGQTKRAIGTEVERLASALGAADVELRWVKKAGPLGTEWNRFMSPLRDL